ncbi:DgyrCDS6749 [Dimorphilus gyrociliatus]|uniref:Actin-related protein 2/3 complex subunit 5 n=1 Tax=Dimorphilus gyrociliatus TaxID=2664684 RepID=A0A7I8VNY9_9ANNE|nr:DgyrCDS6749 [Dimorphilus gyrociliatus]
MSKNTSQSLFRKVDVDKYTNETYEDDTTADGGVQQGPDQNQVFSLLQSNSNLEALRYILANAPVMVKSQAVKDAALQLAMKVLTSFKSMEIERAVKSLERTELDMLMKYIYRGFEYPVENSSAQLLVWHEKVFQVGGTGCILRVLTDRKRV